MHFFRAEKSVSTNQNNFARNVMCFTIYIKVRTSKARANENRNYKVSILSTVPYEQPCVKFSKSQKNRIEIIIEELQEFPIAIKNNSKIKTT